MGDLEEAPAVHFNFPLLSFSLYIAFKSGLPLPVSLFLRNRGGLVNVMDPSADVIVAAREQGEGFWLRDFPEGLRSPPYTQGFSIYCHSLVIPD